MKAVFLAFVLVLMPAFSYAQGFHLRKIVEVGDVLSTGAVTNLMHRDPELSDGEVAFRARTGLTSGGVFSNVGGSIFTITEQVRAAYRGVFARRRHDARLPAPDVAEVPAPDKCQAGQSDSCNILTAVHLGRVAGGRGPITRQRCTASLP